jgi:hypothetical protein
VREPVRLAGFGLLDESRRRESLECAVQRGVEILEQPACERSADDRCTAKGPTQVGVESVDA